MSDTTQWHVLRAVPTAVFNPITPGGFEILAALTAVAQAIQHDVTITSAADGEHSGPEDPHRLGKAYDVRTHDLPDKELALAELREFLPDYFNHFYAFIEDEGTPNEHIHVQVKENTTWP